MFSEAVLFSCMTNMLTVLGVDMTGTEREQDLVEHPLLASGVSLLLFA